MMIPITTTCFVDTVPPTMLDLLFPTVIWLAQLAMLVLELVMACTIYLLPIPIRAGQSARDYCMELLDDYELDHLLFRSANKDASAYIDRKDFSDHVRYERIAYGTSQHVDLSE
jgi:hypothetical protein